MPSAKLLRVILLLGTVSYYGQAQEGVHRATRMEVLRRELSQTVSAEQQPSSKCGTPLFVLAHSRLNDLSVSARRALSEQVVRPQQQKSRLSPSGHFRIHYDTAGVHAPALLNTSNEPIPNSFEAFVDSAAAFFDLSWSTIVDQMLYAHPLPDGVLGGGPEYDVYIEELGVGFFGYTSFEGEGEGEGLLRRFTSSITIDNDFQFVRTKGMNGLKAVAAHEFFHAVQIGGYGIWAHPSNPDDYSRDFYFYELSSVWMEDIVFPDVNDYLLDLPVYFSGFRDPQDRSFSFTTFTFAYQGYERSLWAHFLAKRFGREVLRDIWVAINTAPFLGSMDRVLNERGSGFAEEYTRFSQWNYFTGFRADTTLYYPEGHLYPVYTPNVNFVYNANSQSTYMHGGYPLSTQVLFFTGSKENIYSIITNVDLQAAQTSSGTVHSFQVNISPNALSMPYQQLKSGMNVGFVATSPVAWRVLHIEPTTNTSASVNPGPSPNPIRTSEVSFVSIPVTMAADVAEVTFVSSSLDKVFSNTYSVENNLGKRYIQLPTRDFGSSVESGIYFIIVHSTDAEERWKVAVIR